MRQQTSDQRPLRIGEVACIAQAIASIVRASGFGPWHRALHRIFANPTESQPAEITHSFFGFFGQALRTRVTRYPDRKSTRLNSSHTEIYTLSLHDALPISPSNLRKSDGITAR